MRIIGEDHLVTNNYFANLRGDAARAAVCFMNGIPGGPLSGYAPVRNALVSNNTFIGCKVSIEVGVGAGKKQSATPEKCRIAHNVFAPDKWELARFHAETSGVVWKDNIHQSGKSRKQLVELERRDLMLWQEGSGLFRPRSQDSIRVGAVADVKTDLDGYKRTDDSLASCDDPVTPQRTFVTSKTTGPLWLNAE